MRVHDSQAYRKMDVTRERISCILELGEILSSIHAYWPFEVNPLQCGTVAAKIKVSVENLQPSKAPFF